MDALRLGSLKSEPTRGKSDRVCEGPSRDFREIWLAQRSLLWPSLFAFTGGRRQIAEDALAEAFAQAIAKSDSIRDPLPWIFRVAMRAAAREMKAERVRDRDSVDQLEDIANSGADGSGGLHELVWAIRQLPANQRAAIVLHYELDRSVQEIASLMGIRPSTVKVHLHRGRASLRRLLGSEDEENHND